MGKQWRAERSRPSNTTIRDLLGNNNLTEAILLKVRYVKEDVLIQD